MIIDVSSISTISQGKVSTFVWKLNEIEQSTNRLHSSTRFALEKIVERHFLREIDLKILDTSSVILYQESAETS